MFEISNIRKEKKNGWVYLKVDFKSTKKIFNEDTMWFAVEEKNEDMVADDIYDAFVLVPLILGMYYKQDVHIKGKISPRLYHNIQHYLLTIFDNFSDKTQKISFTVDGFKTIEQVKKPLIGTGISCGVDSLTTIYDNFIEEKDPNFRINSLFLVNTGTHGDFEDPRSFKIWEDRVSLNQEAADELGLPMYLVNTNFHAFTHKIGEQKIGYLAIYSCFLGMQKYIKRYLTAGTFSYQQIADNYTKSKDKDIAEFSESYMCHLISTEIFELVIDGCQYTRSEKTEKISNWEFAQKHINVCLNPIEHGHNCTTECSKCLRTIFPLEALNKLEKFSTVFNIDKYRKKKLLCKIQYSSQYKTDPMATEVIDFCKAHGQKSPNKYISIVIYTAVRVIRKAKKMIKAK